MANAQSPNFGRYRPQLDPPRFTQTPTYPGRGFQQFPLGPAQAPYRVDITQLIQELPADLDKRMVFHVCGDTGGVRDPNPQQIVAEAMEADAENSQDGLPAFFYHLGDVVYYNGESTEYFPQYYLPYEHYPLPIVSIPGNHDGDPLILPDGSEAEKSLSAWIRNFCSNRDVINSEAGDVPRHAMRQPNPFWTLLTPQATFIGLYTNVPEGGEVQQNQRDWFFQELSTADKNKAIFVCMHHPIFSGDRTHSGSPAMKELLDKAVEEAGVHPDIVFAAHVHNYQRFTRTIKDRQFPYIVAGAGGYWHLHPMAEFQGSKVTPPFRPKIDTDVVLEQYVDNTHGFLRVEVEGDTVTCRYLAVRRSFEPSNTPARVADLFQVHLNTNKLER
jgi:acid phosphatase type 7